MEEDFQWTLCQTTHKRTLNRIYYHAIILSKQNQATKLEIATDKPNFLLEFLQLLISSVSMLFWNADYIFATSSPTVI